MGRARRAATNGRSEQIAPDWHREANQERLNLLDKTTKSVFDQAERAPEQVRFKSNRTCSATL
jgi:hypothetical protein